MLQDVVARLDANQLQADLAEVSLLSTLLLPFPCLPSETPMRCPICCRCSKAWP